MKRSLAVWIRTLLLALSAVGAGANLQAQLILIDNLKANYLDDFVDFVSWENQDQPSVRIGVMAPQDFFHTVQTAVEDRNTRTPNRFEVILVSPGSSLDAVDVLFVAKGYKDHWQQLCEQAQTHHVLLVGEEPGFLTSGGCIEFVVRKNRLQFMVSTENSSRYGIELSSKLIKVSIQ